MPNVEDVNDDDDEDDDEGDDNEDAEEMKIHGEIFTLPHRINK